MATYCTQTFRFRGRLVEASLRYCAPQGFNVIDGKPIIWNEKNREKAHKVFARQMRHRQCCLVGFDSDSGW